MNTIELTLTNGNMVTVNKDAICYMENEGEFVKIQFIGTEDNYIEVNDKYEDILKLYRTTY